MAYICTAREGATAQAYIHHCSLTAETSALRETELSTNVQSVLWSEPQAISLTLMYFPMNYAFLQFSIPWNSTLGPLRFYVCVFTHYLPVIQPPLPETTI